jgi:ATP-dependent Clp protease adaptor protein ClpS
MMADIVEAIKTETRDKFKTEEPGMYDVLFLNDDITTVEFVIKVLKQIFNKTQEESIKITEAIHTYGQGIVGTYLFEIAEQKGIETTLLAREEGFPLQVKVQKQK